MAPTSSKDYHTKFKSDPKMVGNPREFYAEHWTGWEQFTGNKAIHSREDFYSWEEWQEKVRKLSPTSERDYKEKTKDDPRMPAWAKQVYSEHMSSWEQITGRRAPSNSKSYYSWEVWDKKVKAMAPSSIKEYKEKARPDPKMSLNPRKHYKEFTTWEEYTGRLVNKKTEDFYSWEEWQEKVKEISPSSETDYKEKVRRNPKMPQHPRVQYAEHWTGWRPFTGKRSGLKKEELYCWEEWKEKVKEMKPTSSLDYQKRAQCDPRFPQNPKKIYPEHWTDWKPFTGNTSKASGLDYYSWEVWDEKVKAMAPTTAEKYREKAKSDPRMPLNPKKIYAEHWTSWEPYTGHKSPVRSYKTLKEAMDAVQKLDLETPRKIEYTKRYREDPKLPAAPWNTYKEKGWFNWSHFLQRPFNSLETAKFLKLKKVTTEEAYKNLAKTEPSMVPNPVTAFNLESFNELLTLTPYIAEQVLAYNTKHKIYTVDEYDQYHADKQAHMPRSYRIEGYIDQYSIVPIKPWHFGLPEEYQEWFSALHEYVTKGVGLGQKKSITRKFIADYLAKNRQPTYPADIFKVGFEPASTEDWSKNLPSAQQSLYRTFLKDITASIFSHYCCFVDEETGEEKPLEGFTNHFARLNLKEYKSRPKAFESTKHRLPFYYIEKVRNWIIPKGAESFKELTNMRSILKADWYDVNETLLDKSDPDCVYRQTEKGTWQMWSPVRTIANLVLYSAPYRGQQILWLDSGEADEVIVNEIDGQFVWQENTNPLSRSCHAKGKQAFLHCLEEPLHEGELGAFLNTNKTGDPHVIPYMPENLAKWIIKLRNWQSKYNPLNALTAWSDIKLSGEKDKELLTGLGHQCFLFRDPSGKTDIQKASPYLSSSAFQITVAAILYNIQDDDYPLATMVGDNPDALTSYSTRFTPHCLRVSQISAMVLDYGLPLEVAIKIMGHSQVLMTLYYTKIGATDIRNVLNQVQEKALADSKNRINDLIKNKCFDEAKSHLFAHDTELIDCVLVKEHPRGTLMWKDYGICPYSNGRCDEGGIRNSKTNKGSAVEAGYLGSANCLRCRFFITGAPFAGGLAHLANEIGLERVTVCKKIDELKNDIALLEREEYQYEKRGLSYPRLTELLSFITALENINSQYETLTIDWMIALRFAKQSERLLDTPNSDDKSQLIVTGDRASVELMIDEVSEFRLLTEICRRSEFYISAQPLKAIPKRTVLIDRMAAKNGIPPFMCLLDDKQQLKAGNQLTKLLCARLDNDWALIDKAIEGSIKLDDLGITESDLEVEVLLNVPKLTAAINSSIGSKA